MFFIGKLPHLYDPNALLEDYARVEQTSGLSTAHRADGNIVRSLSITSRPGSEDPIHDGNESQYDPLTGKKVYSETEFSVFNDEFRGSVFEKIYNELPFTIGRMRVSLLPPLTIYRMHQDYSQRAHMALASDANCFLLGGDGSLHNVPVDGRFYVFDTTQDHTAFNCGYCERLHLVVSLADTEI